MSLDVSDCLFSYPALCDCLQSLSRSLSVQRSQPPQVVSLAFSVESVEALSLLRSWAEAQGCHFYFEKSGAQESVLAVGEAMALTVAGASRFEAVRDWVMGVTPRVVVRGDRSLPFFGPHFFCGFSFFDQTKDGFAAGSVFLPLWQIAQVGDRGSVVVNRVLDQDFSPIAVATEIWKALQDIRSLGVSFESSQSPTQSFQAFTSPDQFKTSVLRALETIETRAIQKIVLALSYEVKASEKFDVVMSLHRLRQLYQGCYIFACNNDRGETFLGASPERLVKVYDRKVETDALAGSAPRGETPESDLYLAQQLLLSEKDRHEHQLVIDFITKKLMELGLDPKMLDATLLQLPNIQHLHTPIHAVIPRSVHILDLVAALHPTPAVAGVPRDLACTQIQQLETFDRSRYAAPIGWVDGYGNGEFAVGIRSAIVAGDRAQLFAGAGIVKGSNPEKELAEVQLKLQALLRAIG
jgi:menaquinone-specific isochorismate synthase